MTDNQRYKIRPDVRFRIVAGEGVIIRQEAGEAIAVNEVGGRILELLREGTSSGALIENLIREYEVGRTQLEKDIPKYLEELETAGVVEIDPVNP